MKAVFINGSPRKNWNTHKLLDEAMRGAAEAGAETELVHLYDYNYKGCYSCFACKVKGSKTNGVCAIKDELRPVLEKVMDADVLVIGSPIYFGNLTAETIAFMERLMFAVLNYKVPDADGKRPRTLPKEKKLGLVLDMNCGADFIDKIGYTERFSGVAASLGGMLGDGKCPIVYSCDTWQFDDYDKYDVNMFDVEQRRKMRETQFPIDLQNAYNLGKSLVEG